MSDAERLTLEQIMRILRDLPPHIPDYTQLTIRQAQALRAVTQVSPEFILPAISALGESPMISSAVGATVAEMYQDLDDDGAWTEVEGQLMALLAGVRGAKLVRKHRLARRALRTYRLAEQLAHLDAHRNLIPHVEEMQKQMNLGRKKTRKAAPPTE